MIKTDLSVEVKSFTNEAVFNKLWSTTVEERIKSYFLLMDTAVNNEHRVLFPEHTMTNDNNLIYPMATGGYKIYVTVAQDSAFYVDVINSSKFGEIVTPEVVEMLRKSLIGLSENIKEKWLSEMNLFIRLKWRDMIISSEDSKPFPELPERISVHQEDPVKNMTAVEASLDNYLALYKEDFESELEKVVQRGSRNRSGSTDEELDWETFTKFFKLDHPKMIEFKGYYDKLISELNRFEDEEEDRRGSRRRSRRY